MEPKKPYFEVELLGSKKAKRRRKLISILCGILLIAVLIYICIMLINVFSAPIHSKNYYYVYIETDATNAGEAEEVANDYRVRGGAGITILKDDIWCVVMALYLNSADAENVVTQLTAQNISAKYDKIATNTPKSSGMDTENVDIVTNIYEHYLETIETLYEFSIALDDNSMTESNAELRIKQLSILWEQRTQDLADKIGVSASSTLKHPLLETYSLSLQITGLLEVLANENSYTVNLITYMSLVRKTTFQLAQISFKN